MISNRKIFYFKRISLFLFIVRLYSMKYLINRTRKYQRDSLLECIIRSTWIRVSGLMEFSVSPDFTDELATKCFYVDELKITRLFIYNNDKENEVKHFIYTTVTISDLYLFNTLQMCIQRTAFELVKKIFQELRFLV